MNRGLVYFHFDPHHQVRDYVVAALSSLRPHANHILLVSNSPISEVDAPAWRPAAMRSFNAPMRDSTPAPTGPAWSTWAGSGSPTSTSSS